MTSEELNRTMEFIVQSQARLAAAQAQDREERVNFEISSKALDQRLANVIERLSHLLEVQSHALSTPRQECVYNGARLIPGDRHAAGYRVALCCLRDS